jgi:hypothetical protein
VQLAFSNVGFVLKTKIVDVFPKLSTARPFETMKISEGIRCRFGDFFLEVCRQLRENELMASKLSKSTNERACKPPSK